MTRKTKMVKPAKRKNCDLRKENNRLLKRMRELEKMLKMRNRWIKDLESKLRIAAFDLAIAKAQAGTE